MAAYNRVTRKLQDLRPRVIIPMHGRTCLGSGGDSFWLLDRFSKSRRERKQLVASALGTHLLHLSRCERINVMTARYGLQSEEWSLPLG